MADLDAVMERYKEISDYYGSDMYRVGEIFTLDCKSLSPNMQIVVGRNGMVTQETCSCCLRAIPLKNVREWGRTIIITWNHGGQPLNEIRHRGCHNNHL